VLRAILNRLASVPEEGLAAIEEENVHNSCIYIAYDSVKRSL
jgi:hypothetical protein